MQSCLGFQGSRVSHSKYSWFLRFQGVPFKVFLIMKVLGCPIQSYHVSQGYRVSHTKLWRFLRIPGFQYKFLTVLTSSCLLPFPVVLCLMYDKGKQQMYEYMKECQLSDFFSFTSTPISPVLCLQFRVVSVYNTALS